MPTRDLIYGFRSFSRRPGFTSLVILILALGIAFVTIVASLAHSIYMASVPYEDPDRIVVLWRKGPEPIHEREAISYLNILDWAEGGEPFFEGLAAYTIGTSSVQRAEGALYVTATYVEPYFFEALSIDMALGRPLMEEDNQPSTNDPVVVLSHGFWRSACGEDAEEEGHCYACTGVRGEVCVRVCVCVCARISLHV